MYELRRGGAGTGDGVDRRIRDDRSKDGGKGRIRCPRCGWEPARDSRWMCECLHVWNTFETGGRCPACGREWLDTQCLRCHEWSRHRDWYVE